MIGHDDFTAYIDFITSVTNGLLNVLFTKQAMTVLVLFIGFPLVAYLVSHLKLDSNSDKMVERK